MTDNQIIILKDIHKRALSKHNPPVFGQKGQFTLQIPIDARMLPNNQKQEALELRGAEAFLLEDKKNVKYFRFLDIAGVLPYSSRIRIPIVINEKNAKRMQGTDKNTAAIIIELSETSIGVRLVVAKPPLPLSDKKLFAAIGRDFGYSNTISLSVAVSEKPIDLEQIMKDGKEAAQAFFNGHSLPTEVKIVERVRFSGAKFLVSLEKQCSKIDKLSSKISLAYQKLEHLKLTIIASLGLTLDSQITPSLLHSAKGVEVRTFFQLLKKIKRFKELRLTLYGKISRLKKNWFGYLSNVEVRLAKKYNAALVREQLDVVAIKKNASAYKGRTFNKMINHGSKGQYQNRATDKLNWDGIPEIKVPSWYTSRACTTHGTIVEAKFRRGDQIYFDCCQQKYHADEHAADTIATMLFVRPKVTPIYWGCDTAVLKTRSTGSLGR